MLVSGLEWPCRLEMDETQLYFTALPLGAATIRRIPKQGGAPVTPVSGQMQVSGLAMDDRAVYWSDRMAGTILMVAK